MAKGDKQEMTSFYNLSDPDPDKEPLPIYESSRLIGPNSYDNDYKLTRYTAELRNKHDDSFFAFIDFDGDEGSIRECPHCLEYGFHNKLQPSILKKGEQKSPDYDMSIQCYSCGNVFPIYEAHYESQITDSLETVNDPFESQEPVFLSTDSRATQRKKRERKDQYRKGVHKYKSKRLYYDEQEDLDIQIEIDRHGSDNVRIIQ